MNNYFLKASLFANFDLDILRDVQQLFGKISSLRANAQLPKTRQDIPILPAPRRNSHLFDFKRCENNHVGPNALLRPPKEEIVVVRVKEKVVGLPVPSANGFYWLGLRVVGSCFGPFCWKNRRLPVGRTLSMQRR